MTICYDEFFLKCVSDHFSLFWPQIMCIFIFKHVRCLTVKPVHFVKDQVIDMKGIGSVIGATSASSFN